MEWFVLLQSETCDDGDRARFWAWLDDSESHRLAYAEAERLWGELGGLKDARPQALHAARSAGPQRRASAGAATALLLLVSLTVGLWWQDRHAPTVPYVTGIGERIGVELADGSHIEVNAASRLTARISWLRREIDLQDGEALFDVRHRAWRPFTVSAGHINIRDIGTRFNVRRRQDGTTVTVLEGEVELNDGRGWEGNRLSAGFRRRLDAQGKLGAPEAANHELAAAWTQGRLVFERTPLGEVAAELARHHPVRFSFAEPALARETLSGTFDAGDLHPFLRAVEKILPVRTERKGDEIFLDRAQGRVR
ncbi:FecR domain-containing protein [Methylococcus sp. EFPC2]|uniref:FecR family protein n=1 Tax=Methylococcus sp. EFPC2 TaxID=2812648 RepID=UPI0019687299|nr:FecR domain-containing protein [Methylococcus sp. EFPC2]QSA98641.1 FecR domain-containing protein [Methylococcus sp. EFPC2]